MTEKHPHDECNSQASSYLALPALFARYWNVDSIRKLGRWLGVVEEDRLLTDLDRRRILTMIDEGIAPLRIVEFFGYTDAEVREATRGRR